MSKILLVEDDNNLREIFEMRLQAEGYVTITASDGEEALVVAMKEKPDLIIADVMMPKLSGFEMLETLRAAPDMKDVKVIMMTALGQAEDRVRGENLGVVKYLVKSQVTLEDFVRVVRDVMQPSPAGDPAAQADNTGQVQQAASTNQESENKMDDQTPSTPSPAAGDGSAPSNPISGGDSAAPADSGQMSASDEQSAVQSQVDNFASSPPATDSPAPAAGDDASATDTTVPSPPPEPTDGPTAPTPPTSV